MPVQWTPDLSTKVEAIDDQHRELFRQLDLLLKAWHAGKGRDEVEKILQLLDDYVSYHFRTEERFMETYRYSSTAAHKAQHAVFTASFGRLKDRYFRSGADASLIEETNELVVDWFVKHLRYSDKALGLFLKMKVQTGVGHALL
ncbi:MAG: hypothetical protein A2078_09045 [Nitrospirae bacterium GWC2_57_9]|nr:MAG: hypothetical protein A2078_09045 [Nitrospirae bacterium GWC2_57_9]